MSTSKATFAAGCFWGVEEWFRKTPGVVDTRVGYIGGATDKPTYRQVCVGDTGHAEAVEVTFDPAEISYEALCDVFWQLHDPTTVDRQGPDVGSQYRSSIFVHDEAQRAAAEASKERIQKKITRPVVTLIEGPATFWEAEDYHQQYIAKTGRPSCHLGNPYLA
ncbi:MAG: peptide-methionine (S)-S-oxide reductase MsrA [Phycisphaera sp.]|nr:peptide-methionine (S)-S-oxide reductase MsrA [Phycisphaera sp.]